jgi:hypothetical protein
MKEEEGMWYEGVHRDSEPRWTMMEGGGVKRSRYMMTFFVRCRQHLIWLRPIGDIGTTNEFCSNSFPQMNGAYAFGMHECLVRFLQKRVSARSFQRN